MSNEAARLFLTRLIQIEKNAYFVGGCVRDALLGKQTRDIDVSIQSQVTDVVDDLERLYPGAYHIKRSLLNTALLTVDEYDFDLASFRMDVFTRGDGIPVVTQGTFESDLSRRDFTINTGYIPIDAHTIEEMLSEKPDKQLLLYKSHPNMLKDLEHRQLVVLHENAFIEDASRMLRAVKYMHVLGFELSSETHRLFKEAQALGVLQSYSQSRFLHILQGFVQLECGMAILKTLSLNGLLMALPQFSEQQWMELSDQVEHVSGELLLTPYQQRLVVLLKLYEDHWSILSAAPWLKAQKCSEVIEALRENHSPSILWYHLLLNKQDLVVKAVILLAKGISTKHKAELLYDHRHRGHIQLAVNGHDLLGLGYDEGKDIGIALQRLLEFQLENGVNLSKQDALNWLNKHHMKE